MMLKSIFLSCLFFMPNYLLAKGDNFNRYTADLKDAFRITSMKICVDSSDSYPYYFIKDRELTGIHVDLVSDAMDKERIAFNFVIKDFATCLKQVASGEVDAVIDVAYTKDRAEYIKYPDEALLDYEKSINPTQKSAISKYAIGTVDYVVVTLENSNSNYLFNGDPQTLPQPVRVVQDDAVIDYLSQFNLDIRKSKSSLRNFETLVTTQLGSVIEVRATANFVNKKSTLAGKFVVHSEMIYRDSLYLGFSKKSKFPEKVIERIWARIQTLKKQPEYLKEISEYYKDQG